MDLHKKSWRLYENGMSKVICRGILCTYSPTAISNVQKF